MTFHTPKDCALSRAPNAPPAKTREPWPRRRWLAAAAFTAAMLASGVAAALFTNGDFESGFAGWTKSLFTNPGLGGPPTGPFSGANIVRDPAGVDRSAIVTASPPETGVDPKLGPAATLKFPKFGARAARINGAPAVGQPPARNANTIIQQSTIAAADVDPIDGNVHVRFAYAPVLQNPNHQPYEQPYFYFSVRNVTRGGALLYESLVFAGQPGVPWKPSPLDATVLYTDWKTVDIAPGSANLAVGDVVELEAIGADCSQGGHYGYVYVDGFGSQIPGLSVIKAASPSPVVAGQNLTYLFTYRNTAATAIGNVVVKETIPACATFVSAGNPSTGGTCSFAAGVVTCTVGAMAANSSGTFSVTVTASADQTQCQAINNGNYTIEGNGVSPTLGPLVVTPIVNNPQTVGVNKDLRNNTGQAANDIEILLQGAHLNPKHYDGQAPTYHHFATFEATLVAGGNTRLRWSNPDREVLPGEIAHVGFNVPGTSVTILGVFWTRNGVTIGCAHQCVTNTHLWGTPNSRVIYANQCLACESTPIFAGSLTVEWHADQVPLGDLNPIGPRFPLRTDVIPNPPVMITPGSTAGVDIPPAPPGARFGVLVHKVGGSANLSGPDVTTDFLQFPVPTVTDEAVPVPALSAGPTAALAGLLLLGGVALLVRRRRRA